MTWLLRWWRCRERQSWRTRCIDIDISIYGSIGIVLSIGVAFVDELHVHALLGLLIQV